MAKQKGSDTLLQVDTTGSGNYVTMGGIQNARVTFKRDGVDVTNQGSTNKHREMLAGAAILQMSVSGDGVWDSAAPQDTIKGLIISDTHRNWKVIIPGDATYTAAFAITSWERGAAHDKEVTFSIALENAGAITVS
jgi:TP901-1 family phage major tail protein